MGKIKNVEEANEHAIFSIHAQEGKVIKKAELESLHHQDDLIAGLNPEVKKTLKAAGFDEGAFIRGVADSDMGKLGAYKELLTTKSAKSDLLLNFLTGRTPPGQAASALREPIR